MTITRTPSEFETELIRKTHALIDIALHRQSPEHCHAVIDYHFTELGDPPDVSPLELAGISSRLCEILYNAEISSVEQLCEMTRDELLEIQSVGPRNLREIIDRLAAKGLALRKVV